MATNIVIRPFIQVIALAESGWQIAPEHKKYIDQILTVYFYDQNSQTNCCEVTPSYELIHLEYQVRLSTAGYDLDDELQDAIRDTYQNTNVDESAIYMHCTTVDSFIKWVKAEQLEYRHHEYGDIDDSMSDKELMEMLEENDGWEDYIREGLNSNSVM